MVCFIGRRQTHSLTLRGERRYDPSVVHARLYRRREPTKRLWPLDTGGEGIGEVREMAFAPPAEAAVRPPACACDGVRNSFHAFALRRSPAPLCCGGGKNIHNLCLSMDT